MGNYSQWNVKVNIFRNRYAVNTLGCYIFFSSLRERSSVMEGMVNLAFILLGAKAAKGRETVAEKLWKFGGFILVKLIKKHNEATGTVLQRLIDCIISGQAVTQYTGEQCDITCTTTDAVSNMAHAIRRFWNMYAKKH